ncbi:MAG: outer membrane protein assembly factor BamD [Proteobacteria bacterium]|nr:outer membrane protein assembly factor BamD [Pseudomonadota bacterium]
MFFASFHIAFLSVVVIGVGVVMSACQSSKDLSMGAEDAYVKAKESYDNKSYKNAIDDLQEFRSRYPYSRFATTAELLMANAHFELADYPQATAAYQQFTLLHPDHPQLDFAYYRIGLSYWKDAPDEEDREQDFTKKALNTWKKLKERFPHSSYTTTMEENYKIGEERVMNSEIFVTKYYCKQEHWLTCFFLMDQLVVKYHATAPDSIRAVTSDIEKYVLKAQKAGDEGKLKYDDHLLTRNLSAVERSQVFSAKMAQWQQLVAPKHN